MSQESSAVISAKIKIQTQTSNDGLAYFADTNGMTAISSEFVIRILCELFELFELAFRIFEYKFRIRIPSLHFIHESGL